MAIVTQWGNPVEILGTKSNGMVSDRHNLIIAKRTYYDGQVRTYHPSELRADGGLQEIIDTVVAVGGKMEVFE